MSNTLAMEETTRSQKSKIRKLDLVIEIERLLQSDASSKRRLSSQFLARFAEVALLIAVKYELEVGFPCISDLRVSKQQRDELTHKACDIVEFFSEYKDAMKGMPWKLIGKPSNGQFRYPDEMPKDKEVVDTRRRAESTLDVFWSTLDSYFLTVAERPIQDFQRLVFNSRTLPRTAEFELVTVQKGKRKAEGPEEIDAALAALRVPDTIGDPGPSAPEPNENSAEPSPQPRSVQVKDTIKLSKMVYSERCLKVFRVQGVKVFRKLFASKEQPGKIKWTDFLHAMRNIDFQIQKQYGSMWIFEPKGLGALHSIIFHEPTLGPGDKVSSISYKYARFITRRLGYLYGFDAEMFAPKTSKTKGS